MKCRKIRLEVEYKTDMTYCLFLRFGECEIDNIERLWGIFMEYQSGQMEQKELQQESQQSSGKEKDPPEQNALFPEGEFAEGKDAVAELAILEKEENEEKENKTVGNGSNGQRGSSKQSSIRSLALGAMCAGLMVALALLGYYLPFVGRIALIAIPLPLAIVTLRYGLGSGVMSLVAAGVLLSMFLNPLSAISISVRYGILGVAFGACWRKRYSGGKTFTIVTIICVLSLVLGTCLSFWVSGVPVKEGINMMAESVNAVFDTFEDNQELVAMLPPGMGMDEYIAILKKMTYAIFPAALVAYGMIIVWMNYFIGGVVFRKLGYAITPLPSFTQWRMPFPLLLLTMLGMVAGIIGKAKGIEWLSMLSSNLLYITLPLFFLAGLGLFAYVLFHRRVPQVIKTLLLLGCFVFAAFAMLIITVMGMCDTIFDLRQKQ